MCSNFLPEGIMTFTFPLIVSLPEYIILSSFVSFSPSISIVFCNPSTLSNSISTFALEKIEKMNGFCKGQC